ncbi:MAG: hypothetical protein ACLPH3_06685, partial [Terracidiphilus sp.]
VLFLPDSDGEDKSVEFSRLEAEFERRATEIARPIRVICCAAVPEVEAWLLAGHPDKWDPSWQWGAMRADRSIKENYFHPFLERHGQNESRFPDEGRRQLMLGALRNYDGLKQRCPELRDLESRIRACVINIP